MSEFTHFKETPKKSMRRKPPPEIPEPDVNYRPSRLTGPRPLVPDIDTSFQTSPKPMGPKPFPQDSMPYPVNDPVEGFYEPESPDRKYQVLNHTPQHIPSLKAEALLDTDRELDDITPSNSIKFIEDPASPRNNGSNGGSNSMTNGSNGYNTYHSVSRTPTTPTRALNVPQVSRYPSSSAGSSPGRSPTRPSSRPSRSPTRSVSRSPSPRKGQGRSPSLLYDFDSHDLLNHEIGDYDLVDDMDNYDPFAPGYTPDPYYNDPYYYDDEFNDNESPTSNNVFDYSILPDLPSSPTKKITLNSTFSFVKGDQDFDDEAATLIGRQRTRKKHDALPPVPLDLPPVPLDLPNLPFSSSSLMSRHFATCENVWSLSSIFQWCLNIRTWIHDLFILKTEFKKALVKLLVYHKRDIPLDTIGPNVDQIISSLSRCGAISYDYGTLPDEKGEKSLPTPQETSQETKSSDNKSYPGIILHENVAVSGILTDLTRCYCYDKHHKSEDKLYANKVQMRCLSSRCYLNRVIDYEVQFRNKDVTDIVLGEDWALHWKLSADDIKSLDKNLTKRQSLLFDLLRYEQTFIQRAKCFVETVGPEFVKTVKVLLNPNEIILVHKFDEDVVNPGKELLTIHQKTLFEPLLKVLISNGKFIKDVTDIADIYFNWSQVAKPALLKYMGTVPMIEELLKVPTIKQWVDVHIRTIPTVKKLKVNGPLLFLSTFNSRYQQLPLQLSDIKNQFEPEDGEQISLSKAIEGIKKTSSRVNEMKVHADNIHGLKRIQKQLVWKSTVNAPNINFGSENRRLFYRGDLTRKGDLKINSSVNHIILLDNYLLITERVKNSKSAMINYRVIENPIPIEFLLVEIKDRENPTIELNLTRTLTQSLPQQMALTNNRKSIVEEDQSIYPIKIRYAGHGKYNAFTFSTKSERERGVWIDHLMKARTNLCGRLRKVEPFSFRLISNTCFAYEESNKITKLQECAEQDPIENYASDAHNKLKSLGYSGDIYSLRNSSNHVAFSTVQAGYCFEYHHQQFTMIGLASGVFCSDMSNEWRKIINTVDTTKISVVPEINLVVILSDGSLRYYPLDVLIECYYGYRSTISSVALSHESVSFFEIGKHREIPMLFFAKKRGNSLGATNFKVCIPEVDNDGIFSSFKVVKRFYVQAECLGISIFNTSFAVHTNKGIEILDLDKLVPISIPEIPNDINTNSQSTSPTAKIDSYSKRGKGMTDLELIKKTIYSNTVKPMAMFKLNNNSEFLLAYSDYAIFVNKNGKLSRLSMLKFDFRAKSVGFCNNNFFIVCEEVIEIWSISDFAKGTNRLIQVITGKDIKMINNQDNYMFSLANPKVPGLQLIFELR